MFCRNCGCEIPEGGIFCPRCGESIKIEVSKPKIELAHVTQRSNSWWIRGRDRFMFDWVPNTTRIGQISINISKVTDTWEPPAWIISLTALLTFNIFNVLWAFRAGILISNEYRKLKVNKNVILIYLLAAVFCWGYVWDIVDLDTRDICSIKNGEGYPEWHLNHPIGWAIYGIWTGMFKWFMTICILMAYFKQRM